MIKKYDNNNVFAKILRGEIPCNVVFENDSVLAFYDIFPAAKVHVLVIPKGEYIDFDDFCNNAESGMISRFFKSITEIVKMLELQNGYRLIVNFGPDANQTVPHFHVHIMGGERLPSIEQNA